MEKKHDHEINIIIDNKHLTSPNPTTGNALYTLGQVPDGYDLFLEEHGQRDDTFIPKNDAEITLHNGNHFYTAKSSLNPGSC